METTFECVRCGQEKNIQTNGGTGYATDDHGQKTCYACCADVDREFMREHGKMTLYLTEKTPGQSSVSNWPGTLLIQPYRVRKGRHNIAGSRTDVWFTFENQPWHGVNYGENSQVLHCKRTK